MGLKINQINLQHSKAATAELVRRLYKNQIDVVLAQEPYQLNGKLVGINVKNFDLICINGNDKPRSLIIIRKDIKNIPITQFCKGDETVVSVMFRERGGNEVEIVLCSAYFPGDSFSSPPSQNIEDIVEYCKINNKQLIMGCDCNAHNTSWGSTNTNSRGVDVMDFILRNGLEILNVGDDPTFVTSNRREVLDITITTNFVKKKICNWKVSTDPSSSDHQYIEFTVNSLSINKTFYRNPRKTNTNLYKDLLADELSSITTTINRLEDLDEVALKVSSSIVKSFESSCPLRVKTSNFECPWFTPRLMKLRRLVRRLWNKSRKKFKQNLFDDPVVHLYKLAIAKYNKEVKLTREISWKRHCEEVDKVEDCARLHKLLSKGSSKAIGAIKRNDGSGNYTERVEETLDVLLKTHFPDSTTFVNVEEDLSETITGSSSIADEIVTKKRLRWAIDSFKPYKSPGRDGIYPFLLQEGIESLEPLLIKLFRASITSGHIPKIWRGVRVTFIPKAGRASFTEAKSFRPISLMSFILKVLERLIDRYIRENALVTKPLHKYQYAYQAGKSTEAALHSLIARAEKTLDQKEIGLAIFLDIEGAFDNTSFEVIVRSAERHGVHSSLTRWMYNMLKTREVTATLYDEAVTVIASRGCPQGGCLSCLMWSLVVNGLLDELNEMGGIWAQGYADDIVIYVSGKFASTVTQLLQQAINTTERWCQRNGLSINPSKTAVVPFTRQKIKKTLLPVKIFGSPVRFEDHVKYLGVILDSSLTWSPHIEHVKQKAKTSFWTCRRMVGSNWGLKPKMIHWLYTQVILPRIAYGSVVWWHKTKQKKVIQELSGLQRMASVSITGAMKTTPGAALEVLLNLTPLHLKIEELATISAFRLAALGLWVDHYKYSGHTELNRKLDKAKSYWKFSDKITPLYEFNHLFNVIIKDRDSVDILDYDSVNNRIVWFTDGSKTEFGSGSGVYNAEFNIGLSVNVGENATVYQSELKAIELCANECVKRGIENRDILICSDSQAALKALTNSKVTSKTVWNCLQSLQHLGNGNNVTLIWVPGHCGIEGNEKADELAGEKTDQLIPDLVLPISQCLVKGKVSEDIKKSNLLYWQNIAGQRQAKELLGGPNERRTKSLLNLDRTDIRKVTRLLTGHCLLKHHLEKMGLADDTNCRLCGHHDESSRHILCDCPALGARRFMTYGKFQTEPSDIEDVLTIPKFTRYLKISF